MSKRNTPAIIERRVQNFDTICPDITENFCIPKTKNLQDVKKERKSDEQLRDEAIREKYPKLPLTTKSTARFRFEKKTNLFL